MISLIAWEVFQGVRADAAVPAGSWSHTPFDLVFLVLLPALSAFAFTRLFLVLTQSEPGHAQRLLGHLQPVGLDVLGGAGHRADRLRHPHRRPLPRPGHARECSPRASSRPRSTSSTCRLGYLLLGFGFFLATIAIIFLGQGAGQRLSGGGAPAVRPRLAGHLRRSSSSTWASAEARSSPRSPPASLIVAASLWILPPSEVTHDPIGAFITPGAAAAGLTLIIWTVVVGGQPTWP